MPKKTTLRRRVSDERPMLPAGSVTNEQGAAIDYALKVMNEGRMAKDLPLLSMTDFVRRAVIRYARAVAAAESGSANRRGEGADTK